MDTNIQVPVFCDWIKLSAPVKSVHRSFDRWIECSSSGVIDWRRQAWVQVQDERQVTDTRKSDSTKIRARYNAETSYIHIDGNLGRWGKRDNVWGRPVWQSAMSFLDFMADRETLILSGSPTLHRVDLTANIAFRTASEASAWIAWAQTHKIGRANPRPYATGSAWVTENWSAKVYDKLSDLRRLGHKALADTIEAECGYLLRLETTLRTDELTRLGLTDLAAWQGRDHTMAKIFMDRFKPLLRGGASVDELTDELPMRLSNALDAWRNGKDFHAAVRDGRLSRRTYYRLRSDLLAYGVDIASPCNVVAMRIKPREVQPAFVAAPEWYRTDRRAA